MANLDTDVSVAMIKNSVMDQLTAMLGEFKRPIQAGISVVGHDYWVVLEYGSAPAEQGTREAVRNDQTIISLPSRIPSPSNVDHTHEAMVGGSPIQSTWYPIRARYKKTLFFIDRHGRRRFDKIVYHPGIKGRGFLRRSVRAWKQRMLKDLQQWAITSKQSGVTPTRRDFVTLVNYNLRILLDEVRAATPVGTAETSSESTHLRDAWFVIPAE